MKIEVDIDKLMGEHSKRRIELMRYLCEAHIDNNATLNIVNELRYLTGVINELEKIKKKNERT
jgi:hypothetical protein